MAFKTPLEQAEKLINSRKFTIDDARNHIRAILGQDRNNAVIESYDDYLLRNGQKAGWRQEGNGPETYPKNYYKTILANDKWLQDEVLPYLDEDNYYGDWETTDDVIEKNLTQMGYRFREGDE